MNNEDNANNTRLSIWNDVVRKNQKNVQRFRHGTVRNNYVPLEIHAIIRTKRIYEFFIFYFLFFENPEKCRRLY